MKRQNTKRETVVLTVCFALAVLLLTWTALGVFCGNSPASKSIQTYTVCEDGEYYSETTYYMTESAYKKSDNYRDVITAYADSGEQTEFAYAATKSVWVEEKKADDAVIESRRLNKQEKELLENNLVSADTNAVTTGATEDLGTDATSFHKLSINMWAVYVTTCQTYIVGGWAEWEQKLVPYWESNTSAEEAKDDCLSITWGGDKLIGEVNSDLHGYYYNGEKVETARSKSDGVEGGYFWTFKEKSGWCGSELKSVGAYVNLIKPNTYYNIRTSVKTTYVHTWGGFSGSFKITASTEDGVAAELTVSETTYNWQIQIDIPKIYY